MGVWSWVGMRSYVLSEIELIATYITLRKIKSWNSHSTSNARVNAVWIDEYIIT